MDDKIGLLLAPEADQVLDDVCSKEGIDPRLFRELLRLEQDYSGMRRRRGLFDDIDRVISSALGEGAA
ncbi:hypothetical protein BWQ93_03310 [Sphingopyxis sp. QXT-31]|nr:hypothetical protein BWQ93_03310 [Sphingopyxis sp. QXT-31]